MHTGSLVSLVRNEDYFSLQALLKPLPKVLVVTLLATCDSDGHTPLHWAAMSEHPPILEYLLTFVSPPDVDPPSTAQAQLHQTPLHWACVSGNSRAVRALSHAGADLSRCDAKGYNSAIHAAQYGRIDVLHILLSTLPSLLQSVDHLGNSLLQWAAYYDHFPTVRYLLIVHAVPPDSVDKTDMGALHRAAQGDHFLVTDALLRSGADTSLRNNNGLTPCQLAAPHTRTSSLLRRWDNGVLSVARPTPRRHTIRRHSLVLFFVSLLILSYGAYHSYIRFTTILPFSLHLIFHVALFATIISHMLATFGDPGEIPRGNRDSFVQYIEHSIDKGCSSVSLLPSAYCFTCFVPRPPRSKHSRDRDACVRLFDHECPWINNTVGLYNHKPLLVLAFSNIVAESIYIFAISRFLCTVDEPSLHGLGRAMYHYPVVTVTALMHFGIAVFCSMLFVTHIRLILRGKTTYEHLNTQSEDEPNPHDFGTWRNLWAFISSSGPGTHHELVASSPELLYNSLSSTFSTEKSDINRKLSEKVVCFDVDVETGTTSPQVD